MLTSFKNHLNQGEALYLLLSNFTLDDPKQSGEAGNEMHSGFLLIISCVWRQQKYRQEKSKSSITY
jgi:hypothetical protein